VKFDLAQDDPETLPMIVRKVTDGPAAR